MLHGVELVDKYYKWKTTYLALASLACSLLFTGTDVLLWRHIL